MKYSKRFPNTKWIIFTLLIFAAWTFLPTSTADANAAPPPTRIWISFYSPNGEPATPAGFQVHECKDSDCTQPTLLDQFGTCNEAPCLKVEPSDDTYSPLACSENTCILMTYYGHEFTPFIRIVGSFGDATLASQILPFETPAQFGSTLAWKIRVLDNELELSEDPEFQPPVLFRENFLLTFGMTLLIETLVAGLALYFFSYRNKPLAQMMLAVALINFISYLLTWSFPPLLARFVDAPERSAAIAMILMCAIYAVLLVVIGSLEGRSKRITSILTVVSIPITLCILMVILIGSSYANYDIAVNVGLPSAWILLLSETFAVVFEGGVLYLFLRKSLALPLKHAMLTSLIMNVVSFLAGLLLQSM